MDLKKSYFIAHLVIVFFTWGISYSQISVGAPTLPLKGTLLDIKQGASDANNTNSTKGVLFPRVFINDKTKLGIDVDGEASKYAGAQVYNTNGEIGKGMYTWDGVQWVKYVTSVTYKQTQDTEMIAFKTTGINDTYSLDKANVELTALTVPSWTATLDGNMYITTVLYASLVIEEDKLETKRTDLGNTFFKIELRGSDGSVSTFLAGCTPINAFASAVKGSSTLPYYAKSNPAVAIAQGAAPVKKGVTYSIKVLATEGWAPSGTVTVGTYSWKTFNAYSTLKADFISVPY